MEAAVHRIAYGVLRVAVNGKGAAPQIRAQRVAGDAVDLHPASAHARADKPLPKAAGDAAGRPRQPGSPHLRPGNPDPLLEYP